MSFLDDVRASRKKLADVLSDPQYSGIRNIVEELYPDRAHFIYELLQNAEDAGATEASFVLQENLVSFKHNGRPFNENDIWGITNIGKGTKKEMEDKIGRFGVGFKAVFAYTETPHIWSPTFSFKISDLVLPTEISAKSELGQNTFFEFPFNNPKKNAQDAYAEVKTGLEELAETTLLYLTHLESIRWQLGDAVSGEVLRIEHSESHIEVLKHIGGKTTVSSHFLRFSDSLDSLKGQNVSVAFVLDYLPNISTFDPKQELAKQLKIVPAIPSRVAVFFPAEKESSGLRFHLNAPFVPELSRASVKETPANGPLFKQLAKLAATCLSSIRNLNLLTGEFLGVLPNPQDDIPSRYEPIRASIVEEMNERPLTPTYCKSHAPAKILLQAKASLKELLSKEDIEFLVPYEDNPPLWAISAAQKNNNADRFLSGLEISAWDITEFIDEVERNAIAGIMRRPHMRFMEWLKAKPIEWHQQMYSLFYKELNPSGECGRLDSLRIARLSDGEYGLGSECYFPSDGVEHDEILPRIAKGVYSSGKSKTQQTEARKLLEEIGVREVGEAEEIQAILTQRYATSKREEINEKRYLKDLKRFITLVAKEPQCTNLFADFYIFEAHAGIWKRPNEVFLDLPFFETGLRAYYQVLGDSAPRTPLAKKYLHSGISIEKLRKFAEAVGVQAKLNFEVQSTSKHPERLTLRVDYHPHKNRWPDTTIDEDWILPCLESALKKPSEKTVRLLWNALTDAGPKILRARFRFNKTYDTKDAPSSLVLALKKIAWIPQKNGEFVLPALGTKELLPRSFPFDASETWLRAIGFGEEELKRSEEYLKKENKAKELGFTDAETMDRAKQFSLLPRSEQVRVLDEFHRKQHSEMPERESRDPSRRSERVGEQAADAPGRVTEKRERSVAIGDIEIRQAARQFLRDQYTNADGAMFCQICKDALPFKLDDGNYFFEAVEFLEDLTKRYHQNYIALCPNHAAMFQHVHGSRDLMKVMFARMEDQNLEVTLAQVVTTIYFTKIHAADLKTVIQKDGEGSR